MRLISKLTWFCSLFLMFTTVISSQNYDNSKCTLETPVSNLTSQYCNNSGSSCQTFIVYRAQEGYNALASIAALFNSRLETLHSYNNLSNVDPNLLPDGYEIIIPTTCSCSEEECEFCLAVYAYNASISHPVSLSAVACGTFEGLVTTRNLGGFNLDFEDENQTSSSIQVPLKCSCPSTSDAENGIAYLATYPILQRDTTALISLKFNVSEETIRGGNRLNPFDAIFPQTTLFIPLTKQPYLNPHLIPSPPDKRHRTEVLIPSGSDTESDKSKRYFLRFGAIFCVVIFSIIVVYAATAFVWNMNRRGGNVKSSPARAPKTPSNFSPEFLDGMTKLKHSFTYFSLEELMIATGNFSEGSLIGPGVYRGEFGGSEVAIKQITSREVANNIICILTKINHLNVVKLEGYYDGTSPFLVFELAGNGCLRDCLSSPRLAKELTWRRRIQIAFDLAEGLQYLHYCTKPTHVHRNINSRNVLITAGWRAKISGFGSAMPRNENEGMVENPKESSILDSTEVDVYAFGLVLLELLSAREATKNGHILNDFLTSAAGKELHQDPSRFLETLEQFIDPVLEGDYPVDHVLCLACIAKCCMEENPLKRITIGDVVMALSKIL